MLPNLQRDARGVARMYPAAPVRHPTSGNGTPFQRPAGTGLDEHCHHISLFILIGGVKPELHLRGSLTTPPITVPRTTIAAAKARPTKV